MRLIIAWPAQTSPSIGEPKDAPPEPIRPHIERAIDRGIPEGARVLDRGARIGRRGHPYWYVTYSEASSSAVHAVLLFIDVTFEVTVIGDPEAILAAIDDGDLVFDEAASIHQLFGEGSR